VLASDIHVGNLAMPVSRLDRIVDQINAQHADAILLAGDFVNGYTAQSRDFHPDAIVAPLSRLKAPWGKFAVMGNHDAATAPERVESALTRAGITMLNNRATRIGGIALIGLDDVSSQRVNFARGLDSGKKLGGVPVVMAHSPEVVSVIPLVVPLIMTGHTHCGEIRAGWAEHSVDLWHWVSHDPQNLTCGLVHEIGRDVIVTGGVGASSLVPIRLNAPPDFWVITLVPAPSKPGTPLSRKRGAPISMP
jgi:predicted MPP superfamily phosphohydrolase